MYRILLIVLALLIPQTVISEDPTFMESFDRKSLTIEDEWSGKEVGYKDSELVTFFRKNLGAKKIAGHPDLQNLIYFTISYEVDDPRGFPTKEVYAQISDFEDEDVPDIETESNSIHVASVLKNGIKDLLFYVSDPDAFLKAVNENNSKLKGLKVDLELANDPKWEIYANFP